MSSQAPQSWQRDTRQTLVFCFSSPASLSRAFRPSQGPTEDREALFILLQSGQLSLGDASTCSLQGALIAMVWGAFWVSPSHKPPPSPGDSMVQSRLRSLQPNKVGHQRGGQNEYNCSGPQFPHLTRQIPSRETHGEELVHAVRWVFLFLATIYRLWSAGSPCVRRFAVHLTHGSTSSRKAQRCLWPSNRENGSLVPRRCKETTHYTNKTFHF